MKNKSIFYFAVVIIFFLICYHFWPAVNFDNSKYVEIAGQKVAVELALTNEAKEQGLSGRTALGENEGMLFVFDRPDKYSFWMKGMKFPLDIIWLGENLKVVYIKKEVKPETFPESYKPDAEAKYVLEVQAGFSDKNNLKTGDSVLFIN